jgi:uncharacterized membrane protein
MQNDRLLNLWQSFRSNLWFMPALMGILTLGMAIFSLYLDRLISEQEVAQNMPWLFTGSPEGARMILTTVATSMMTVAGLVFSITLVAMNLTSSQFGHRLLRNFISDIKNQIVLGTFLSTFLYCLIILRDVRGMEDYSFVPQLSINIAIVLAILSLGVLVYFIHHVAIALQCDYLIDNVSEQLEKIVKRMYEETPPEGPLPVELEVGASQEELPSDGTAIHAWQDGYIQTIDYRDLLEIAEAYHLRIAIQTQPGAFVNQGERLAILQPFERQPDFVWESHFTQQITKTVNRAFMLGTQRNYTQDLAFGFELLVEIAARALSPSTNAPYTAIECLDRLGAALIMIGKRPPLNPFLCDQAGHVRITYRVATYESLVGLAFNQIRHYAPHMPVVMIYQLKTLQTIAAQITTADYLSTLLLHARLTEEAATQKAPSAYDVARIQEAFEAVARRIHLKTDDIQTNKV